MSCVTESHSDGWRWSRISTKMNCNFLSKSIFGASSVDLCSPLGRHRRFQDHGRATPDLWGRHDHRYWPPTLDSSDFHSILEREQCKSLTAVVTKSKVQHEKITPNIPQTFFSFLQNVSSSLWFFLFCVQILHFWQGFCSLPMTPYRRGAPMPRGAGSSNYVIENLNLVTFTF